ncbi:hypothetical protein HMPREF1544_00086 [Mucor circinelloides 1006PhL]|uniref:Cryptic loci regulator 2 N-terminal domain-containing protein n=1 Tax=Mucor circinelloides f. circinelloides (strain 1006PhL) TaxID=1220926 RepID=S2JX27_MUCC1|nr:hypothetical protein HMPREF1544_00086 [Mucor circinelloides 1006PhL]
MAKSSRKGPIQVKPPLTDAKPPFLEARLEYKLDEVREQRMLETLGAAIYESRQKKSPKVPVLLTSLPKGYYAEYKSYYRFAGHPSNIRFNSTSAFLIHLLWLEDMSHPSSIRPRRKCSCVVCEEVRNKGTVRRKTQVYDDSYHELTSSDDSSPSKIASTSSESAAKAQQVKRKRAKTNPAKPTESTSPEPVSRESTPDDSESIEVYPLKRILIERHVNPHYYYPDKLTIPLPKIQESDQNILLKSLRP